MIVPKLRCGCCCLRQLTFCNCAERSLLHPLFLYGDPSLSLCISRAVTRLLKWDSQYRATLNTWRTEDAASRPSGGARGYGRRWARLSRGLNTSSMIPLLLEQHYRMDMKSFFDAWRSIAVSYHWRYWRKGGFGIVRSLEELDGSCSRRRKCSWLLSLDSCRHKWGACWY